MATLRAPGVCDTARGNASCRCTWAESRRVPTHHGFSSGLRVSRLVHTRYPRHMYLQHIFKNVLVCSTWFVSHLLFSSCPARLIFIETDKYTRVTNNRLFQHSDRPSVWISVKRNETKINVISSSKRRGANVTRSNFVRLIFQRFNRSSAKRFFLCYSLPLFLFELPSKI